MNGARASASDLVWLPRAGIGYYPVENSAAHYDEAYFQKYVGYAQTELGRALTAARIAMVARHYGDGPLIDIGIGCGQFVDAWPGALGYDVNPAALRWLIDRELYADPYVTAFDVATFWDSLEHIAEPAPLLANVRAWAFVSLPIFRNAAHVRASRHFRPDEHYWYFTEPGLLACMASVGFECVERSDIETQLGREDIVSFAFRRRA